MYRISVTKSAAIECQSIQPIADFKIGGIGEFGKTVFQTDDMLSSGGVVLTEVDTLIVIVEVWSTV